jgi:predicted nucleotidyltransferase
MAAGAPPHRALEALRRLELEGLVTSRVVGRAYVWTAARRHPLLKALKDLFEQETAARDLLVLLVKKHLGHAGPVEKVALFGSAARGEERPESDLDLLVVVTDRKAAQALEQPLSALRAEAQEGFGTRVRPLVYTRAEYTRKRRSPLIQSLERDAIMLIQKGA